VPAEEKCIEFNETNGTATHENATQGSAFKGKKHNPAAPNGTRALREQYPYGVRT
jgi:hypothetical protein